MLQRPLEPALAGAVRTPCWRLRTVHVAQLAAKRVARVRRVSDHTARADDVSDLDDRPLLRIGRMDVEVPGHSTSLGFVLHSTVGISSSTCRGIGPDAGWTGGAATRPAQPGTTSAPGSAATPISPWSASKWLPHQAASLAARRGQADSFHSMKALG